MKIMISDNNQEAWDKILISVTFAALKRWLAENDSRANKEIHYLPNNIISVSAYQLFNISTYQHINLSTYYNV